MRLLLDTHVVLWAAGEPEKLSPAARRLLTDPANHLFFSAASIWEVVIKKTLGRKDFVVDPPRLRTQLLLHGYAEVPVTSDHALLVEHLPLHHRDPFDRVLIAQSRTEGMKLVTVDATLQRYGESVLLI